MGWLNCPNCRTMRKIADGGDEADCCWWCSYELQTDAEGAYKQIPRWHRIRGWWVGRSARRDWGKS